VARDFVTRLDWLEARLHLLERELAELRVEAEKEAEQAARMAAPTAEPKPATGPVAPRAAAPAAAAKPPPSAAPVRAERPAAPPPLSAPGPVPRKAGRPPRPPGRSPRQLAEDWDLIGPRGFAIVGGSVLALGIGLFFVLAANRGWIGQSARVALGAAASALALGAGIWMRARFGQYWAALGAVGAGIAGAYATLAAATARYDLVPDALGLPIAGVIAAIGTAIAIRWHSQVIAGIGLLGAALAPALQAIDTGLTWESVAFALIVLAAAVVVTIPRSWHELLHVTTAVVAIQALVLVRDVGIPADRGTVGVTAALVAVVLAAAVWLQLASALRTLDEVALAYALVAFGIPLATTTWLFEERGDRGLALVAAAAIWIVALGVLARAGEMDLALVVGVSALALTAVGTALLLSGAALTLAWAAEAVVLSALAARFEDARLHVTGIAYAVLATLYALGGDAVPGTLFDEGADHRGAVVPLAASAAALVAAGLAARSTYAERTESGLLAFVANLRRTLELHRLGVRETLVYAGTAAATLAASFALVSTSWDWGHVAATEVTALVGAAILVVAAMWMRDRLAAAAYVWLAASLVVALAFDVPEFYVDETRESIGGWALLGAAVALLGGSFVHRLLVPAGRVRDFVAACAATVAAAAAVPGIAFVTGSQRATGVGVLAASVLYAGLAGNVFRRPDRRDFSTTLWSLAVILLVGGEMLLITIPEFRVLVVAMTAVALGELARPLREERLWLAGGALGVATSAAALLTWSEPLFEGHDPAREAAVATGSCAAAVLVLAGRRWGVPRWRDLVTVLWVVGLLATLAAERLLLGDLRATAIAFALSGGALALAARPLGEPRVWMGGAVLVGVTLVATLQEWTQPSHLLVASDAPADGLWVLLACLAGLVLVAATADDLRTRIVLEVVAGGVALYALSLGILEIAERVSGASVEADFERGHTAVSGLWALVGLGLLVLGLLRGASMIRYAGLALFGLSLAKIFLYDLSSLSSLARAFSFILVGGLLLAGGFFLQRLSDRLGPPRAS
jgi:hypothetical protein